MRITRATVLGAAAVLTLAALAVLAVIGNRIPEYWSTQVWAGGFINGTIGFPPFPPLSTVQVFPINNPQPQLQTHFYLLGSDAGGRDLFALTARGAVPSLELVGMALVGRMVLGLVAGFGIALGATPLRAVARAAGGWIAGFPYLALAVLVIQALTGGPGTQGVAQPGTARLFAFVVAIGAVGWRDIAEVVAGRIQWVQTQPFTMGARAVGSTGFGFFRRHVWPYLRPALTVELSFQASAVLVLLAELGFLQYYVGGFTSLSEDTQGVGGFHLAIQPELGQLLSDVRLYDLRQEFAPVLVPALALAVTALAFEIIGRALRGRADLPA
jgi:ABC-type dipeptide/oligopeptide/nickel transport system permease subunit